MDHSRKFPTFSTSKLRHTKRHLLINGVITNLLFLLCLRSTTRKLLGNEVQVKRKINGGDIDWALGAATWSLKWVGLGKHLQEQWIFRDSILGWAWHHDRFESNGGNLQLKQLKPAHPGHQPAEALVHLLQTRQSSISWIKSPGAGAGMVEWSINGMGRRVRNSFFVFAVKAW